MTSTAVTTTSAAPPALAPIASTFEPVQTTDIKPYKLYLQQPLSEFVQSGLAKPGDIMAAPDVDDPFPIALVDADNDHFVAYVIGREKFAATTAGGGFEFHDTPNRDLSDPDSWEGWFFDLAIPSIDKTLPVRWMLWRTAGTPAARAINTLLERAHSAGDLDPLPIRVSVRQKTSRNGHKYYAPAVTAAQPEADDLDVARNVQATLAVLRSARASENEAPVIVEQPQFV